MATYTLIESQVLGTAAASVTFSSIPATYTDLVLRASVRTTAATVNDNLNLVINGSSAADYSITRLNGDGTSAASYRTTSATYGKLYWCPGNNATADTFGNLEAYFASYTAAQAKAYSTFTVSETNATGANMVALAGLWNSTAAITSINIYSDNSGNLVTGSSFNLYGISNTI